MVFVDDDCQCDLPTLGMAPSFVVYEQDACDVSRPWRVSFANLGPCWLDILYYQTLQSILRDE